MKHGKKKKKSKPNTKREKLIKRLSAIILGIFLVSAIFTVIDITQLLFENRKLEVEKDENEKLLNQVEDELKNVNSDEYVEDRARKQFNMINPGEKLYIIEGITEKDPSDASEVNDNENKEETPE